MNNNSRSYHPGSVLDNQGFSLVELLVALTLIGLVSGFVWSAWLFSDQSLRQWREHIKLQTEFHTLLNGISEDLYRAKLIRSVDSQHILLEVSDTLSHDFTIENKKLLLNDKPLTGQEFQVTHFNVVANDDPSFLTTPYSGKNSAGIPGLITIQLEITNGRDTLRSERSVSFRKPSAWTPLNHQ
jgi:prepilin-type N-terminal cleavage/methylation domain-containing protein